MSEVPSGRRVGVRDVAREAGVSTQTVSRVLNDYPGIRRETRDRVLQAVESLDYRINNTARAFGTQTSRTVGLIASNATLYGPSIAIEALDAAARSVGRWIAIAYADAADPGSVDVAARHLVTQGVDGIVVLAAHERTLEAARIAAPDIPVRTLHDGLGSVRQVEGAALAVEHLLALGHRRIARIDGPSDWLEATARQSGVLRALNAAEASGRWEGDWTTASGSAIAGSVAEAIGAADGPTAVVVANDQMALGLIAGLRDRGIVAPADVSITGFDDNPDAAFYAPSLTTVRLDILGEARRVMGEVVGLAPSDDGPGPAELVVRASTATLV